MPTERLLSIVESNDTSTHLVASSSVALERHRQVEDGLAVLGLAGLQEARVGAGLDEVALGVEPEQPHRLRRRSGRRG